MYSPRTKSFDYRLDELAARSRIVSCLSTWFVFWFGDCNFSSSGEWYLSMSMYSACQ